MPFRATTATGNQFDFDFPLHPDTVDPVQVSNLLSAVLDGVDREIRLLGKVGNGDVLQAMAMALAVRTRMLGSSSEQLDGLVKGLLETALAASAEPGASNLSPDAPRH